MPYPSAQQDPDRVSVKIILGTKNLIPPFAIVAESQVSLSTDRYAGETHLIKGAHLSAMLYCSK